MNFDIEKHTIILCLTGSRLYGTNTPESDWDYKGIAVAPMDYYLGVGQNFEQFQGKWPHRDGIAENHDVVIYDIRKYCHLASLANPNILEVLFAGNKYYHTWDDDERMYGPIWRRLRGIREYFLSKKVRHTYAGFAHSQLKRIRTHRYWITHPPFGPPTRGEFFLPEYSPIPKDQLATAMSLVDKQIEHWCFNPEEEIPITVLTRARESIVEMVAYILNNNSVDPENEMILAAGKKLGFDDNFLQVLAQEKKYRAAINQWKQYMNWEKNRNPARHELEKLHGFDSKHAMHLVRLMRTCEELLTTGKLIVTRPDAEELLAIRNGAWTMEQVEEFADSMDKKMDVLYQLPTCPLPHKPDIELINKTCMEIILEFHSTK